MNKYIIILFTFLINIIFYSSAICSSLNSIIVESIKPSNGEHGRPLPLVAHWNSGKKNNGFSPKYQIKLLQNGHHILPWFHFNIPGSITILPYYKEAIKFAAKHGLPISFVGTQWERLLTDDLKYFSLPFSLNPNVILPGNQVSNIVSPFSPIHLWNEVGTIWTTQPVMQKIQEWYPNPPLILFVSNNEHRKLRWNKVETSESYIDLYGTGRSDDFKRKVVGDRWIERYGSLIDGMREGLSAPAWKANSRYVGYNAFFPDAYARWGGWQAYSLHTNGRNEPWSSVWDGASVPYYTHNWDPSVDFTAWSPQIRAMNQVFVLEEIYKKNPNFWFELSVWDGHEPSKENDKRKYYTSIGQNYTPERYAGMVQFGMWLLRPRLVREFRGSNDTITNNGDYFMDLVHAVDLVHNKDILKRFWRYGRLVENPSTLHIHQSAIPEELKEKKRWFLLNTDLDPRKPWTLETEIPVFSLALELGEKPKREWLIYAFAPMQKSSDVTVEIPGVRSVRITAGKSGHFYLAKENSLTNCSRIQ